MASLGRVSVVGDSYQPVAVIPKVLNLQEQQDVDVLNPDEVNEAIDEHEESVALARSVLENNDFKNKLGARTRERHMQVLQTADARLAALQARLPQLQAARQFIPQEVMDQLPQLDLAETNAQIAEGEQNIRRFVEQLKEAQGDERKHAQLKLDVGHAFMQMLQDRVSSMAN